MTDARQGGMRRGAHGLAMGTLLYATACSCAADTGDETRAAFSTSVEQRFAALDANRDGRLDAAEMRRAGPLVPGFDRDANGSVGRAEFLAGRLRSFDRSDRNGDGVVTRAERRANRGARKRLERGGMPARPGSDAVP